MFLNHAVDIFAIALFSPFIPAFLAVLMCYFINDTPVTFFGYSIPRFFLYFGHYGIYPYFFRGQMT